MPTERSGIKNWNRYNIDQECRICPPSRRADLFVVFRCIKAENSIIKQSTDNGEMYQMEIIGKENGVLLKTELGTVRGNEQNGCYEFLGIPYARAARYEYAAPVDEWSGTLDATRMGKACPQMIDVPAQMTRLADMVAKQKSWEEICRERAAAAEAQAVQKR